MIWCGSPETFKKPAAVHQTWQILRKACA
jgi:hypothetical protein